jgi:hypothetical protein
MRKILYSLLALAVATVSLGLLMSPAGAVEQDAPESRCYTEVPQYRHSRVIPAVEEVSHQEYKYSKQVETFKTQYEIDKFTRERSKETQHYSFTGGKRGTWEAPSYPGSPGDWQANTSHEPHNSNSADWIGNSGLHYTGQWYSASWFYFEVGDWGPWSTPVRYVPIGTHDSFVDVVPAPNWQEHGDSYTSRYQRDWALLATGATQQVSTGFMTEYYNGGDWTTDVLGDPWTKIDERKVVDVEAVPAYTEYYVEGGSPSLNEADASWVSDAAIEGWTQFDDRLVNGDPIPCFEIEVEVECGTVTGRITENNTEFPAFLSGVEGADSPALNDYPWASLNAFEVDTPEGTDLVHEFGEDYNGGSVEVTIFAHGPEQDAYAIDGRSPISETRTVDTDCEINEIPNGPNVVVVQECGKLTATFTNNVEIGDNEFADDATFTFNGEQIVVAPNAPAVVRAVSYVEDFNGGTVNVEVNGTNYAVDTDCVTPVTTTTAPPVTTTAAPKAAPLTEKERGDLALTGSDAGSNVEKGAALLGIGVLLVGAAALGKRRKGAIEG